MQEIPIYGTSFLEEDAQSYPGKNPRRKSFHEINFQHFNADWTVNLAMLPSGLPLSPVSMENMQKDVIICRKLFKS